MTQKRKTHSQLALEWMEQRGEITPLDAIRHFGCMRLAARIHDLRRAGHDIRDRKIRTLDGCGSYKAYRMPGARGRSECR